MYKVLMERKFPIGKLKLLASARSAGKVSGRASRWKKPRRIPSAAWTSCSARPRNDLAKRMAPHIKAAGAVFVDNSSAFRLEDDVPLVVPEINPEDARSHNGIIANPNCSTIISMVAIQRPSRSFRPSRPSTASTYQAVSGAGAGGLAELEAQVRAYAAGKATARRDLPLSDRLQPHPPDRLALRKRLHHRGDEDAKRGTQDPAPAGNEGDLHLRARAGFALAFHQPKHANAAGKISVEAAREAIAKAKGLQAGGRSGEQAVPHAAGHQRPGPVSTSAASGTTWWTNGRWRCGARATRFARARPPTPCRSRNCCSDNYNRRVFPR